jgi:hypothetical protein
MQGLMQNYAAHYLAVPLMSQQAMDLMSQMAFNITMAVKFNSSNLDLLTLYMMQSTKHAISIHLYGIL